MVRTVNGYQQNTESYGESPFADPMHEMELPSYESIGDTLTESWEFSTPFVAGETGETGEYGVSTAEAAAFSEVLGELKDTLFRESLEQLADEALDAHGAQLGGEYGDRESRDLAAERILNEHFEPLRAQADAMLDRFFERVEGYEAEALTDMEIDRIATEVMPAGVGISPASEQFLGGLLRKAGKLVSGAVNLAKKGVQGAVRLAGKGLAAIGKLALGPLLAPLKKLAGFLLQHVVKFAMGQLPPALRPLAQTLADKLAHALGETHDSESEAYEQTETEALPAAPDAARLEAEFDTQAAQLLFAPEEEIDHLVESYGEGENDRALAQLDDARTRLANQLARMQPGDNPQPVMEQFLPALLWPAAKTAITILGRPKLVSFLGGLLGKLIQPLVGAEPTKLLAPAIADAGLRIFGLETGGGDPRGVMAEALAATVEETINTVVELPQGMFENEMLLTDAVNEAFENAAAAYFPNSAIRPELRESGEKHGMWTRMPANSNRKRYAKYSDAIPVEIPQRVAADIKSFGNTTLHDHLRDHHGLPEGRTYKGKVTLYQALPGTRGAHIARAEGFPASQLHPLTPHAAGALLGPNAALGRRQTPGQYLSSPHKLHVHQRLYRIEPPPGRRPHVRRIHSELMLNVPRGEVRIWLYLSEPFCQRVAAELAKGNNAIAAFRRLKPLLARTTEGLRMAIIHRHLPPEVLVIDETPNPHGKTPDWLKQAAHQFGARIGEWAQAQLAQYVKNNAEEFKRACSSQKDGVTLRITMTHVPGMDALRMLSQGKPIKEVTQPGWPAGSPVFQVVARPGYAINRLRD